MRNCSSSSRAEEHVSDLANKNEFIEEHLVLLRLVFWLAQGKTEGFPLGERLNPGKRLVGSPCVNQHCKATQKLHGVILVTRHSPMILPNRRVKVNTHHFERK